jgi:hypothetical protein
VNTGGVPVTTTGNTTSTVSNNVTLSSAQAASSLLTYTAFSPFNDAHIKAGEALLTGQGANLSAFFYRDKLNTVRTIPWDVGAFAYVRPQHFNSRSILSGY